MKSSSIFYRYGYMICMVFALTPGLAGAISLSLNPASTDIKLAPGATHSCTAVADPGPCTGAVTYSLLQSPMHGSVNLHANFTTNGQFSYTNDSGGMMGGMGGSMLGAAKEKLTIGASCDADSTSITLKFSSSDASCGNTATGRVILDNTASTHLASIKTNLAFLSGCSKSSTTIDDGIGGNSINIEDFHVLTRDSNSDPNKLMLSVGAEQLEVSDQLVNESDKQDYFADGNHLFELNRLRSTADWLAGSTGGVANITPDNGVASGAYGTMTMQQFINHIGAGDTLYGVVRVKIGLQRGQRSACSSNCTKNALGQTVVASDLYGFCNNSATTGLCAASECAPGKDFNNIGYGSTVCGVSLPNDAKIKVKGALLFDFVDYATGAAIPLSALPYAPRELYFKVKVPIMVNWAFDANLDGAMDNMAKVAAISSGHASGELTPSIPLSDIPQASRDAYAHQVGTALTQAAYDALGNPDKYHMLMPSGYADGWAEAFDKLNITAPMWAALPPASCLNSANAACQKFGVPGSVSAVMTANDVRSDQFEDIPTYLYSGGLIDMHGHVNVSGLVYVPQAMELEALNNSISGQTIATQQYISGAIVVRDGFYIQANSSQPSITVISADPFSYTTAKRHVASTTPPSFDGETDGPGTPQDDPNDPNNTPPSDTPCIGCASPGSGGGAGGASTPRLWMEVRPQ